MHSDHSYLDAPLEQPTAKDRIAVHKTILRLTSIHKIIASAVVIIGSVVWLFIIQKILHFGRTLDYSGLEALGIDKALVQQYNPFFWWTVVIICTLLVTYLLIQFVQSTQRAASLKIVPEQPLKDLLKQLSPSATQVLDWSWKNRSHPITVGVLQQTTSELAKNRYSLICLAKKQEDLLQKHGKPPAKKAELLHHL